VNPKVLDRLIVLLANETPWTQIVTDLHMHKETLFIKLCTRKRISIALAEKCINYIKTKKPTYAQFYKRFGAAGISSLLSYKDKKYKIEKRGLRAKCLELRGDETNPKMSTLEIAIKLGTYPQIVRNALRSGKTYKRLTPITSHRANTTKAIVKKLYEQGMLAPDIARNIGQTPRSIYYYLDQLGLKVNQPFVRTLEVPAYYAIRAMRDKKVGWSTIAKVFNCSTSQARYFFDNIRTIHPEITQEASING
jgi:hypothetical protein